MGTPASRKGIAVVSRQGIRHAWIAARARGAFGGRRRAAPIRLPVRAHGVRLPRLLRRGDPGFLGSLVKTVTKIAAPITKVVSTVSKIPVVGPLVTKVGLKAIPVVGQISTAVALAGVAKGAVGAAKGVMAARRAAGGSKITSGKLKLPGGGSFGATRPGIGLVAAGGAGLATGVGLGVVPSHRPVTQTQPAPARQTPRRSATAKGSRKCCPAGTKRMVCFKRGRVKKRKGKGKAKGRTKGRTAQQKRFAALARKHRGRIPKGTRL